MGRIRSDFIKGLAKKLIAAYPDKFGTDYSTNKVALAELKLIEEKLTRNKVAGYITRLLRRKRF